MTEEPPSPRRPTLVIAVSQEELRRWATIEVAASWAGAVHIVYEISDLFHGDFGNNFVLLICLKNLIKAFRRHPRRWPYFIRRGRVVLMETNANMERIVPYISAVNAVLVAGLHEGKAVEIVRAVKTGMLVLPREILDRLLSCTAEERGPHAPYRGP
ncbi:MAG TPA: hypothetical protein VE175_13630 [Woeseiaceae bacterium]|nr:hypothetical protein [Woeseiaceae bacterium]